MGRTSRLLTLLLLAPAAVAAQGADSIRTAIPLPVTDSALRLPVDRASDLTSWIPGGSVDVSGQAAWRGRSSSSLDRSIDGIGWGSLVRSRGANGLGASVRRFEPALNAIDSAALYHGAYDVDRSAGGPGLLGFTTLGGGSRWSASGTAESEAPLAADGGAVVSRFEGAVGGPLVAGWRARVAATLTGRESAPTGVGYRGSPYYVPTGIDTTMTWEFPAGDTVIASAETFGPTSSVPYSPRTTTDLLARIDGRLGPVTVWGRYLFGGDDERFFAYEQVSNTPQTFVRDGRTQDLAIGASTMLGRAWTLKASLSWQEERSEEGPIDVATEAATRDPALGILKDGVDLRFDMGNFPVDDELLWNYRLNSPGSRRSPYDLENTAQYALVDQYRNNAYGLLGFSESGGPVGTLNLYRDRRMVLGGSAAHPLAGGDLEVGGELRQHDIQYYSHGLTSQAFSDVWLAKPAEQALFAHWTTGGATWRVAAGLRMDRFKTGARRPKMFPRLSSAGTYVDPESGDTLRWSRGEVPDSAEWYALNTEADEAHLTWSPRVSAEGELGGGWVGHASLGRLARTPDLSIQMAGVNTDLAITNSASIWGTDYGHEITDLIEGGLRWGNASGWIDVTAFREDIQATPVARLYSLFDPLSQTNRDVRQYRLLEGPVNTGVTLSGVIDPALWLKLSGAYTHFFDDEDDEAYPPGHALNAFRHNTLTLTAAAAPTSGALKGFGTILSWRQASGLATAVPANPFDFFPATDLRSTGIPDWKSLDLRITKSFVMGGSVLSVYLDARNLLDAENLLRAFDTGDPRRSEPDENWQWSSDSNDYAREAMASGLYDGTGSIDLTFGGMTDPRAGCGGWFTAAGRPSPINCVYLIGAEGRFGDGDHIFTLAEQQAASLSYYRTYAGAAAMTGPGRALRIGAQIGF